MSKIIAIDYGLRRIGLAVGDTRYQIAMPLGIVDGKGNPEADAGNVFTRARGDAGDIDFFLVGLPMNMDGSEGTQARVTREFAKHLSEISGIPVEFQDERLSSFSAGDKFHSHGKDALKKKKSGKPKRIDAVAAAVILESYFSR